jgi:hypothetical protein
MPVRSYDVSYHFSGVDFSNCDFSETSRSYGRGRISRYGKVRRFAKPASNSADWYHSASAATRAGNAGLTQFSLRITLLRRAGFEELLFAVNQGVDIGRREFDVVTVRDCISWTSLNAITAKNASRIVNIISLGIAIAGRNAIRVSVFGRFDVNAIGRASRGAEEATHAFFQAILITLQDVDSAIPWLNARGDVRIRFRSRLTEHRP